MNIFVLDKSPILSARSNCDRHCVKMVLEIAQMMASCFQVNRLEQNDVPRTKAGTPYKHTHFNHPVTKWIRESKNNFIWAYHHASTLDEERRERNGGISNKPPHFSFKFIDWVFDHIDEIPFIKEELTPFAVAINSKNDCFQYIKNHDIDDPILCYRLYYKLDKPFATWKRNRPEWMDWNVNEIIDNFHEKF